MKVKSQQKQSIVVWNYRENENICYPCIILDSNAKGTSLTVMEMELLSLIYNVSFNSCFVFDLGPNSVYFKFLQLSEGLILNCKRHFLQIL